MNFINLRTYLHKIARLIEKISPMKGELVDIRFIKTEAGVTYKYTRVKEKEKQLIQKK
jgi:hypothetical protein